MIICVAKADEYSVVSALRAGAKGYVLGTASLDDLSYAIQKVHSGRYYLSDEVLEKVIEYYCHSNHDGGRVDTLTKREKEILLLERDGLTKMEISQRLNIRHRTVETHLSHGMKKLHVRNQIELIHHFIEEARPDYVGAR